MFLSNNFVSANQKATKILVVKAKKFDFIETVLLIFDVENGYNFAEK